MQSAGFRDLLANMPSARPDWLTGCGIYTWPPGTDATFESNQNIVRLFVVLDGILICQESNSEDNILPHEVLRLDGDKEMRLYNLSHTDAVSAIEISLCRQKSEHILPARHCYFSDDQKDNKLCLVASPDGDNISLRTESPVEVFLSQLKHWDTVTLESNKATDLLAITLDGRATVNGNLLEALTGALLSTEQTMSVSCNGHCEILLMRYLGNHNSA